MHRPRTDAYLTSDSRLLGSYSGTVTSGENTMYVNTYDEEGFYYRTEIFTFIGDSVYESIETYYDDEEIKKTFLSSSIMIVYTLGKMTLYRASSSKTLKTRTNA